MKRTSYEMNWGNILVAGLLIGLGIFFEPLMVLLGGMIMVMTFAVNLVEFFRRRQADKEVINTKFQFAEKKADFGMTS